MGVRSLILGTAVAAGLAGVPASASAATLVLNSFENSLNGYTLVGAPYGDTGYAFNGFSTTTGVSNGTASAIISPSASNTTGAAPSYQGLFQSGYTVPLAQTLATTTSVSIDVYAPAGSFGYLQVGAAIQTSDPSFTYTGLGGFDNAHTVPIGGSTPTTITFALPADLQARLATNAASATPYGANLIFAFGGGGGSSSFFVDNIVATGTFVPEPAALALAGVGLPMLLRRRRA